MVFKRRGKTIFFRVQFYPGIGRVINIYFIDAPIGMRHPDRIVIIDAQELGGGRKIGYIAFGYKAVVLILEKLYPDIISGDHDGRGQYIGKGQKSPIGGMFTDGDKLIIADKESAVVMRQQQAAVHFRQSLGGAPGAGYRLKLAIYKAQVLFVRYRHAVKSVRSTHVQLLIIYYRGIAQAFVQFFRVDMFYGIVISYKIDPVIEAQPEIIVFIQKKL